MFSHNDTPARRLALVMQQYQASCGSDPVALRQAIPAIEIWRYFIDGVDQNEGFMVYETREKNYLMGICKAFQHIHHMDTSLSIKLMRRLHLLALSDVTETQYEKLFGDMPDEEEADKIGDFRQSENAIFGVVDDNASVAGMLEMLERNHPQLSLGLRIEGLDDEQFGHSFLRLNKRSFADIKRYVAMREEARQSGARIRENPHPLLGLFETLDRRSLARLFDKDTRYSSKLRALASIDSVSDLAEMIYKLACQDNKVVFESLQTGDANALLKSTMQAMIDQYNRDMQALTQPIDKLRCIIEFIQSCEQLHPFLDGNCRVFCMLLLNHLLLKNGFPMAMLPDPNHFDLLSRSELLDKVIEGMTKTMALIAGENVYGIDTRAYLETLKPEDRAYFSSVIAVEEKHRAALSAPLLKR